MIRFYDHPDSGSARRVRCILRHLQTRHAFDVERIEVDLWSGAQRQPDFLALNPNGHVPVLVTVEGVLWESVAIGHYLATRFPSDLWPEGAFVQADILRWEVWTTGELGPPAGVYLYENALKPAMTGGTPDPSVLDSARPKLLRCLDILEAQLAKTPFLCGERPTLADYTVACTYDTREVAKMPVSEPNGPRLAIERWFERVTSLPGWGP